MPVLLTWFNPRSATRFVDIICDYVDNVVMPFYGSVMTFVYEAMPRVCGKVSATMATIRNVGINGDIEAELCGSCVGLVVHGDGREGVAEPGAGQGGATGKEAAPILGVGCDEGVCVDGSFCGSGESALEFDGEVWRVAVKLKYLGRSGCGRW